MSRIIKYNIVETKSMENLIKEVNHFLEKGWQPLGGYVQIIYDDAVYWSQALVVYEGEAI